MISAVLAASVCGMAGALDAVSGTNQCEQFLRRRYRTRPGSQPDITRRMIDVDQPVGDMVTIFPPFDLDHRELPFTPG